MKILIDDVPIKPITALGMPLGYQLPIKQAERIEIIYGAQLQFGEDACAGVINIVTKESERPVNTTADIKFGSERYNEINVFFGGKFGKDKRIVKFDIYGNYTYSNDRNIYEGNDSLFLLKNYGFNEGKKLLTDITKHPNLQNQGVYSKENFVGKLPFESRGFGIKIKYKGLNINFDNLYRKDHSALGFNTRAIYYGNTSDYIAENISRIALSWTKKKRRVERNSSLHGISYRMDPYSSVTHLQPTIYKELIESEFEEKSAFLWTKKVQEDMNKMYLDTFFTGKRYQNFVSNEIGFQRFSKRTFWSKKVALNMGFSANISTRVKYLIYNNFPIEEIASFGLTDDKILAYADRVKPLQAPTSHVEGVVSQWSKLSYFGKKLNTSLSYMANINNVTFVNYPKNYNIPFSMEASYKITPKLRFSASHAKTVAMFPIYMADNSLFHRLLSEKNANNDYDKIFRDYSLIYIRNNEKFSNYNFGISFSREKIVKQKPRSILWTANAYHQELSDVILPSTGNLEEFTSNPGQYYLNSAGSKTTRYGIEITRISKRTKGAYSDISLSISDFKTNIPNFKNDYPSVMLKSRISAATYKNFQEVLDIILLTEPQNIYAKNNLNLKYDYRLTINYLINSNLKANIKFITSNIRSGISAPFLQGDLLQYNPQNSAGQVFIGLNYSLE
jgi:hypothetical protein